MKRKICKKFKTAHQFKNVIIFPKSNIFKSWAIMMSLSLNLVLKEEISTQSITFYAKYEGLHFI